MKTTNQFRDEYGIKLDTYKKYKAIAEQKLGKPIGTKQGVYYYLTSAEEMALLAEIPPHLFKAQPPQNHQGTPEQPPQQPIVTIESPAVNATHIIPTPAGSFDVSAAIDKLDGVKGLAYQNPVQMTQAVQMICGAVIQGLQTKATDQKQQLDTTKTQQYEVEATLDDFNRQVAFLRQKMKTTATEQTASTQILSEALNTMMQLGQEEQ